MLLVRLKTPTVEAVRYCGEASVRNWIDGLRKEFSRPASRLDTPYDEVTLFITSLFGGARLRRGDWAIHEGEGRFSTCSDADFRRLYEPAPLSPTYKEKGMRVLSVTDPIRLRMLAEDLHSRNGHNQYSAALSRAADEIATLQKEVHTLGQAANKVAKYMRRMLDVMELSSDAVIAELRRRQEEHLRCSSCASRVAEQQNIADRLQSFIDAGIPTTCPVCKGMGELADPAESCSRCHGTGTIPEGIA